jgi:hypothetical protein
MDESPTRRLVAILLVHGQELIRASREDTAGTGPSAVDRLKVDLRPFDCTGDFLTTLDAAILETDRCGKLAVFRPLFARARSAYGNVWKRARSVRSAPDWGSKYFSRLTEIAGEIEDVLPVLATKQARRASRKRRPAVKQMTPTQALTFQMVAECEGNIAKAARLLGKDRKTVAQSYEEGLAKVGRGTAKAATKRLSRDKRGQVEVKRTDRRWRGSG